MKTSTWDMDLAQFIESKRFEPFEWRKNDCLTFICDAYKAQTGSDALHNEVHKYKCVKTGLSAYKKYVAAGKSYESALNRVLTPFQGVLPPRGSIIANKDIDGAGEVLGAALGIVVSTQAVYIGHEGLLFFKVSPEQKAWLV